MSLDWYFVLMSVESRVNQSVYTREMSFVYFVTAKGTHWDNLCNHHLPDLLSLAIQRRERIITVLWTLVKCLLYFVTYDLHRTDIISSLSVSCPFFLELLFPASPSPRPEDPPPPLPPPLSLLVPPFCSWPPTFWLLTLLYLPCLSPRLSPTNWPMTS